jgi:hypothetical protein
VTEGAKGPDLLRALWLAAAFAVFSLCLRLIFFEGLWPADAVHYATYASRLDHLPRNHWETRLFYVGALRLPISALGCSEPALALPSLIASLFTGILCVLTASWLWGLRAGLIAGLVAATLPVDVVFATVPLPGCLATLFVTAGVACLLVDRVPGRDFLGPIAFALAMFAHLTTLFLVGALLAAWFVVTRSQEERRRALVWLIGTLAIFLGIELVGYSLLTGDPFYEFRIIPKTSPREDPGFATFSGTWFAWPLTTWMFSKDFGLATLTVTILWVLHRRKVPAMLQALLVGVVVFWIWIGYGSQSPFEYRPFWRSARFGQPFMGPLVLALGFLLARQEGRGMAIVSVLATTNVLLVASSGSWGQDVDLNRELLPAIRSHADVAFLTRGRFTSYGALRNPLASTAIPRGFTVKQTLAETSARYRPVAYLLPQSLRERVGWFLRRPPGQLVVIQGSG